MPVTRKFAAVLAAMLLSQSLVRLPAAPPMVPGPDRPLAERVESLLGQMTLEEKASQLVSWPPAIPRLGIPAFVWDNEGKHAFVTAFPASIGLAATWNPELTHDVAAAISDEARAQNNKNVREGKTQRYLCFWAPTVNMARDPRWGRVNESFGEDPRLTSELAVAFIRGMQGNDPRYLKAAAGVNHFAVYSEERDRHSVDAALPNERLLRDYYLPHFEACIKEGKAAAVGATNNGLNGVPLCVNRFLLTNVLRQEWGFKGFVFSDSASVEDIWKLRSYAPDGAAASALTIRAGCEMNTGIGNTHLKYIPDAVRSGLLDESMVTEACRRVLTVQFRLGIYDPPEQVPYSRIQESVIDSPEHHELALQSARESIVLLKNEASTLPLNLKKLKRIVVAGPRADQPELGRKQLGSSTKNVSALDGIRSKASRAGVEVIYEMDPHKSAAAAGSADVVLFFTSLMEGEVSDRMNLGLSTRQEQEVMDLTDTGTPVVIVLIGSGGVTMERWVDRVPAMISAWYPGSQGGNAIADVLFGDTNPSGKLPLTFYQHSRQLLPFEEFDISKGQTYLYSKQPVQFPFGHGLSYTTFGYTALEITANSKQPGHAIVKATVTNTGGREGKEVAQLYLHSPQRSTGDPPILQLRGFEKISLKPGESRTITWNLTPEDLAFHDAGMAFVVEPGPIKIKVGGSSAGKHLEGIFEIAKKIVIRKPASFIYQNLSTLPATVEADEPIRVAFDVENVGETTGSPVLQVDGKPYPWVAPPIGPGEKSHVTIEVRLHEPGTRKLTLGKLSPARIEVKSGPARLVSQALDAAETASVGEPFPVRIKVRNLGASSGAAEFPLAVDGSSVGNFRAHINPGESTSQTILHRFDRPGQHSLVVDGLPAHAVQVGGPVDARFRSFANTPIADFRQSGPGSFFIRATGAVGTSWIPENNGARASLDSYASLYLPGAAKRQSVITLRIDSQELISNHTKSGIMVRNAINRPAESAGYLTLGINGYYGGVGNIEWDQDVDGYLESHIIFDSGHYPKWLALEKNGRTFRCFYSSDQGETWKLQRTIELASASEAQDEGLFVASDTDTKPALVRFSDFAVKDGLFSGTIATETAQEEKTKPEQPF